MGILYLDNQIGLIFFLNGSFLGMIVLCVCVCANVCVSVREREREIWGGFYFETTRWTNFIFDRGGFHRVVVLSSRSVAAALWIMVVSLLPSYTYFVLR